MHLKLFRHLWGVAGAWDVEFPRFREAGYEGIESRMPPSERADEFRSLLNQQGFAYIPQVFTEGTSPGEHVASLRRQVEEANSFNPLLINSHSGRDAFSEMESIQYFEGALEVEAAAGVRIVHETHRGRILYNPWITSRLLARFDRLRLCCDYSHWVCVCERLLDDQSAILRQCADRCLHLHARVGYEHGPQVPDPRAPEYLRHLEAHEAWWRQIWQAQHDRGDAVSTLTPEFGPPGYLHTLPFTNAPVTDLREICDWQAQRQAEIFAGLFGS